MAGSQRSGRVKRYTYKPFAYTNTEELMELEPNVRLCCALLKRVSKTETGNPTCPDSRPLLGVQGPGIPVHTFYLQTCYALLVTSTGSLNLA